MENGSNKVNGQQLISYRAGELLKNQGFSLSPVTLLSIHKTLFNGIYDGAGTLRKNNSLQKEYIFNDGTITFSDYTIILELLSYEIALEKNFDYEVLSRDDKIKHISSFISSLWQIHPFSYGNTLAIAIFTIKYLLSLGYSFSANLFIKNLPLFKSALVSANYGNMDKDNPKSSKALQKFFRLILLKEEDEAPIVKLNEKEKMVLELLRKDPTSTIDDMAYLLEYSNRSIAYAMKSLTDKGIIERIGSKKNGNWRIKDGKY